MNLTKLDGFGRVQTQTPMQFQGTRRQKKRAKRRVSGEAAIIRPKGSAIPGKLAQDKEAPSWVQDIWTGAPRTKREKRQQKIQRMQGSNKLASGAEPNIGFSRVYIDNLPASAALQGFGRVKYTNKELQGLSLDGYTILQGYGMGDEDDLEDWNFLLSIDHPDTLQGFPHWVLNGKAERKARQAKRKQKRQEKKQTKQTKKAGKQTARSAKKDKREARRGEGKARQQRRKEVRTAKKEERLIKKKGKREARETRKSERLARKQQRLDDRKQRQLERQETKRQRIAARLAAKAERGGMFRDLAEGALPMAADLLTSGGDFADYSYEDFGQNEFGGGFDDMISDFRSMPSEDALGYRDRGMEDFDPEDLEDQYELDPADAEDPPEGGMSKMILPAAVLGAVLLSQKGKKKKKK